MNSAMSPWHQKKTNALTADQASEGERILRTGFWSAPTFGDIGLRDTNWSFAADLPRTVAWRAHQFEFTSALLAYDLLNDAGEGKDLLLSLVESWWRAFCNEERVMQNMPWHDHATALRLSNLLLLRSHASSAFLDDICAQHGDLLASEDFYNRGNNHGLDQSLALFEFGYEMQRPDMAALARERILEEIRMAFAADGGHVENSTGYHHFGISQVKAANDLSRAYTGEPIEQTGLAERAESILAHMTRPDRKLPHIGDTQDFTVRRLPQPRATDIVLEKSGWAIFRSDWDTKAVHGVLKCGFLSQSHRQDDDLSLSLFAHGEEWLIDGGLYAHQQKHPMRIFMRSATAHSLPYVVGVRPSRDLELVGPSSRIAGYDSSDEGLKVAAETGMWPGYLVSRTVEFRRGSSSLTLHDKIEANSDNAKARVAERTAKGYRNFGVRFLIPADKRLLRDPSGVTIVGKSKALRIETALPSKITKGKESPELVGWRSTRANDAQPAFDLSFTTDAASLNTTFELAWA